MAVQNKSVIFVLIVRDGKQFDAVLSGRHAVNQPLAIVRKELAKNFNSMATFKDCPVDQNCMLIYKPRPDNLPDVERLVFEPGDILPDLPKFEGAFTAEFVRKFEDLEPEAKRKRTSETDQLINAPLKAWNSDAGKEVAKGMGLFYVYHLHEAGCVGAETIPAYARDEAVALFVAVRQTTKDKSNVFVTGPPGCGKSLIMWQLVCHMARNKNFQSGNSTVLWVRVTKTTMAPYAFSLLTTSGIRSALLSQDDDTLKNTLQEVSPWLVVVDGLSVNTKHFRDLVSCWCVRNSRRFIFVNSPQSLVQSDDIKICHVKEFQLYAWTEADLQAAFDAQTFYDSVESKFDFSDVASDLELDMSKLKDRHYLFRAKFMLAGHSARWMFDETPRDVLQMIRTHMKRMSASYSSVGEEAKDASNTLFCALKPPSGTKELPIATSAYILSCILECGNSEEGTKFLKMLTVFSRTLADAGFDGIVLEIDFRAELVICEGSEKAITLLDPVDDKEVFWPVKKLIPLEQHTPLADLQTFLLEGDVWLVPVNWKKCSSFDFVCINPALSDDQCAVVNLRIVRISRAQKHPFNYGHVRALINRLAQKVERCEVFVICPTGSTPPKMTTHGRKQTDSRWEWGDYKFLQMQRKELRPMDVLASLKLKR